MAINYGNGARIGLAKTPQFAAAAAAQGRMENDATARANALRSQNMLGAGQLYNAGMGDRSPIADSIFRADNVGETNPELMSDFAGADNVGETNPELMSDFAGGGEMLPESTMATSEAVAAPLLDESLGQVATEMAPEALAETALADTASGALVEGGAGVLGGAGGGALAASMPYLSAALLAKNFLF